VILDEIMSHKRSEVALRMHARPLREVEAAARRAGGRVAASERTFIQAIRAPGVSVIAEAKCRSPSKGVLRAAYDPGALAVVYALNGAAAVSVLTDAHYFGGDLRHVTQARDALLRARVDVPLLRKDFVFCDYQVYEACAAGADAVLLIAALLDDVRLSGLLSLSRDLGMAALVEVHEECEVERALRAGADVVGVNNRDLRDFSVDLRTFGRLRRRIPTGVVAVAESGVRDADDVARLRHMGADAVLVGEAIVTSPDPGVKVRELVTGGAP
jgi:indole-3-glycerol phosphate synthase